MRLAVFSTLTMVFAACGSGGAGGIGDPANADGGQSNDGGRTTDGSADGAKQDGAIKLGEAGADASGGCHENADCNPSFEMCIAPGEQVCGGPAPLRECENDPDCGDAGANKICVTQACGSSSCIAKCTGDGDCPSQMCQTSTGRCVPKPCTSTSCPQFFVCPSDPNQGCVRKECNGDADCAGGACVNGHCWSGAGTCSPLPA